MGKKYIHLQYGERQKIEALRAAGHTYAFIAKQLHRSISTIHNEIHRNTMRQDVTNHTKVFAYDADIADGKAIKRRSIASRQKVKLTRHWQKVINTYLKKRWSLEQISKGTKVPYATNTLYNYAKDGYLRYRSKTYRIKKKNTTGLRRTVVFLRFITYH